MAILAQLADVSSNSIHLVAEVLMALSGATDDEGMEFCGERIHFFGTVCCCEAVLIVRFCSVITPEVCEVFGDGFREEPSYSCLSIYPRMCAGEIIRLRRSPLELAKFDSPFDCDIRGLDDECVVFSVMKRLSAGEQSTCLPKLEKR